MSHFRKRYLNPLLIAAIKSSPLVGVIGMRQVGKTTLLQTIKKAKYTTLDEIDQLELSRLNPKMYLNQFQGEITIIDECQKSPEIFSLLKIKVHENKRPGQFLLTGSIRFTSKKSISESLTGRIITLELIPLTLSETQHLEVKNYLSFFKKNIHEIEKEELKRLKHLPPRFIHRYLQCGGLPGICFLRQTTHRNNKFKNHIETLLMRDIQFIIQTSVSYHSLFLLLKFLSYNQGETFALKEASVYSRISQNTVKKIIEAFEGLFLIRRIKGIGDVSSDKFFLEDQGIASYLTPNFACGDNPRFIFSQIFGNAHYTFNEQYSINYFETKSGLKVDFVLQLQNQTIGFIYHQTDLLNQQVLKTIEKFHLKFPEAFVFIIGEQMTFKKLDQKIIQMPLHYII